MSKEHSLGYQPLVRLTAVCERTSLSRSSLYRLMGQGQFPKPIKLSAGRVAWREGDLTDWLKSRGA
jgi:prophage regulatory protein